jgi:N-acetylglucosamine-6-phosphate deacetylase
VVEAARGGQARTVDGRLAGSSLTLDEAVRDWAAATAATLAEAIAAASEVPLALLGLRSGMRAGAPADLVALANDGSVRRVMRAGRWIRS